jgi:hypothetical protein
MSWELCESFLDLCGSLLETIEIQADEETMAAFHEGVKEEREGKGIPWEEVKRKLDLT